MFSQGISAARKTQHICYTATPHDSEVNVLYGTITRSQGSVAIHRYNVEVLWYMRRWIEVTLLLLLLFFFLILRVLLLYTQCTGLLLTPLRASTPPRRSRN